MGPRPASVKWRFDPKAVGMDTRRVRLDEKNNAGGTFDTQTRENGFYPVKLLFVNAKRCFH